MRIIDCFVDLVKNSVFDYAKIVNKPLQKLSPKDYLWEKDQNYCSTFAVNFLSLRCTFFLKSWKKKGRDFPSTPAAWKPASRLCPLVVVPNMKYRSVVADIYRCNLSGNKSLECTAQIGLSRRRTIAITLQVHSSRIESIVPSTEDCVRPR